MNLRLQDKMPSGVYQALTMMSLILAGESIFLPAFHLGRYFKTPLLTTFDIDILDLGNLGAIYGICATACYFLGGPLADRWSPRKLLSFSLVATAAGSVYMATVPSFAGLSFLFGFWGVTTILVFWAPLIRATREWASDDGQAQAFGILDGGRGLASAVIALIASFAFAAMIGNSADNLATEYSTVQELSNTVLKLEAEETIDTAKLAATQQTLTATETSLAASVSKVAPEVKKLIFAYGVICILAAVCVWLFVPDSNTVATASCDKEADETTPENADGGTETSTFGKLQLVLKSPAIWLQAVVIIAAYSAFKMIDNYGIYSQDAYGLTSPQSAKLISYISFVRVGAALGAGWIADRYLGVRTTIQICFGILVVSYWAFMSITPGPSLVWLMTTNMAVSCLGFFALRGIYFALLEESGTPRELTGTAVGVISFVGFAPEIFMGPLTGWLIRDARAEGNVLAGYHRIFLILLALSVCGVLAAFTLRWFSDKSGNSKE